MKKLLALVLAVAMLASLASLAACGETGSTGQTAQTGEVTKEMMDNSKPNEYVMEKIADGREVQVGFALLIVNFFTEMLANGVKEAVEPLGVTFSYTDAGGDLSQLMSQMENYVQMQCALLVVLPPDGDLIKDTVLAAQEAGTHVLVYGQECHYDTCTVRIDTYESASQQMHMMQAWVDERYPDAGPGEIHMAYTTNDTMAVNQLKGQAYRDVAEADGRFTLAYTEDSVDNVDKGFSFMENAMSVDPDIRVVVSFDIGGAIGMSNYVMANPDLDPNEFGVFCAGEDSSLRDLLAMSADDEAVLRGTILDGETPYDALAEMSVQLLKGEVAAPHELLQPIYALTGFGYSYDSTAN